VTAYVAFPLYGTFSLVDSFGNASEMPVLRITLSREKVEKINWADSDFVDYGLYKRLVDIANIFLTHPALDK
jgi:hypothetical protein